MAETSSRISVKNRQDRVLTELCENVGPEVMEEIVKNYTMNHSCHNQSMKTESDHSFSYGSSENYPAYDIRESYTGDYYSNRFSMATPEGTCTTSYFPNVCYESNNVLPNQHSLQPQCLFQSRQTELAYRSYTPYSRSPDQSTGSHQTPLLNIQPMTKPSDLSTYMHPSENMADFQELVKFPQSTKRDIKPKMRIVRKAKRPSSKCSTTTSKSPKMAASSSGDFTSFHSPPAPPSPTTTPSSTFSPGNYRLNDSGFSSDNSTLSPITKSDKLQSHLISSTVNTGPSTPTTTQTRLLSSNPLRSSIYPTIKPRLVPEPIYSSTPVVHATVQYRTQPITPSINRFNRVQLVTETMSTPTAVITPMVQIPPTPTSPPQENYDPSAEIIRLCKKRPAKDSGSGVSRAKKLRHNEPLNNMALDIMSEWYDSHSANPYPNKTEKEAMALSGNISMAQVKSWFANKRNRNNNTRPKVQKQQMEAKLLNICHQLASDSKRPLNTNSHIINQLSSLLEQARTQSH